VAISIDCSDPSGLLAELRKLIDQGTIATWQVFGNGELTHKPPQYYLQAWFKPFLLPDRLVFGIQDRKDQYLTRTLYGLYHGRLTEALIVHLSAYFDRLSSSGELDAAFDRPTSLA
jgi:hypothetical protein